MPLVVDERNNLATVMAGRVGFISLHTADPGTTGANEVTGSGYARMPVVWGAAASGIVVGAEITFNVPAGSFTHYGLHASSSGSSGFRGGFNLSATATVSPAGTLKVTPSINLVTA